MSIESCRGESATLSKKQDLFRLESKNGFRLLPWKKLICKMNATLRTHPLIHSQPLLQTRCVGKSLRRFAGARAFILVQPCVALTLTLESLEARAAPLSFSRASPAAFHSGHSDRKSTRLNS